MVTIEPLFGDILFITEKQRDTVETAAPILAPHGKTVFSEDERGDGVLWAIFNETNELGQSWAYRLEVVPTGEIRGLEWDLNPGAAGSWGWEDRYGEEAWQKLIEAGLEEEGQ